MGMSNIHRDDQIAFTTLTDLSMEIERALLKITEDNQINLLNQIIKEISDVNEKLLVDMSNYKKQEFLSGGSKTISKILAFRDFFDKFNYSKNIQIETKLLSDILLTIQELKVLIEKNKIKHKNNIKNIILNSLDFQ